MPSDFVKNLILQEESSIRVEKRLLDIHKTIKSRIPEGVADNFPKTVTEELTDLSRETIPSMPWMSFSLINDGPNSVNVVINDHATDKAPVKRGEVLDADLIAKGMVYRVMLYCERGETANVRVYALK
jgi:hypothetical protein